ncbi:hypothetical protein NOF04DRAFT_3418 [Fusarium oxysporum II5]|uniref:Uncharacterized protein n=1 Tax=Fusarium odoratissimum (strain NRRL 54006) TaxID=1089451 RepID=X0JZ06_FUSO5|nr:uncharacterized protein FOIG_16637 [Fusarium odoratissimum NRRL 54006]EXL90089.1 hypothetical protein FOIG_16637 [Fusarium odoratissimum NRRL 54006]KAK2124365.1 hypothetical protein NOF04DRAFT_3418 [Fusarium oxysporum II5]
MDLLKLFICPISQSDEPETGADPQPSYYKTNTTGPNYSAQAPSYEPQSSSYNAQPLSDNTVQPDSYNMSAGGEQAMQNHNITNQAWQTAYNNAQEYVSDGTYTQETVYGNGVTTGGAASY